VLRFGLALTVRVLAFALPALALCVAIAATLLGEHDINYYLAAQPPEFRLAAGLIAAVLAALLVASRLITWSLALPLALFARLSPGTAFRRSANVLRIRRPGAAAALAVWAIVSFCLSATVSAGLYGLGDALVPRIGGGSEIQAAALGIAALTWIAVQTLLAAFVNASFALGLNAVATRAAPEIMAAAAVPPTARAAGPAPAGWTLAGTAGLLLAAFFDAVGPPTWCW
jgi:hypothetical protein